MCISYSNDTHVYIINYYIIYVCTMYVFQCTWSVLHSVVSRDNVNSHFGPVWQVDWVEKERSTAEDRTEVLISIGSDGRVTQWSIRKGFEGTQLMRIKRPAHLAGSSHTNAKGKSKHMSGSQESASSYNTEALISQYTAGLAFDFWPQDFNM